jgi:uncharacterized membrane protein
MTLLSCAFFTALGVYAAYFQKSGRWTLWASFGAALFFLLAASFFGMEREKRRSKEFTGGTGEGEVI